MIVTATLLTTERTPVDRWNDSHRLNRDARGRLGQVKYSCQKKLCDTAASTARVTAGAVSTCTQQTSTNRIVVCRTNPIMPTRLNRIHRTEVAAITVECADRERIGSQAA